MKPTASNLGKRLVRSPKVYIRDSGLVHALLGLRDLDAVLGHPVAGTSWEGYVIEQLMAAARPTVDATYHRATGGAEIDLVLTWPGGERWAVEIKRTATPSISRGFRSATADVQPDRSFYTCPTSDPFPLSADVTAISLAGLAELVAERSGA